MSRYQNKKILNIPRNVDFRKIDYSKWRVSDWALSETRAEQGEGEDCHP